MTTPEEMAVCVGKFRKASHLEKEILVVNGQEKEKQSSSAMSPR